MGIWNRKELKEKAKKSIRRNYWKIIGVLLVVTFVFAGLKLELFNDLSYNEDNNARQPSDISIIFDDLGKIENKQPEDLAHTAEAGVIAFIYKELISAKGFVVGMFNGLNMIIQNHALPGYIIIATAILMLLLWIFIGIPLVIGKTRYFLELNAGMDRGVSRIAFLWKEANPWNAIWIMLWRRIFGIMWWVSIFGGFFKYYSYKMIPYILAENPNISFSQAFAISEEMMYGHKWETFKLDMSFLGWKILNLITLGILDWTIVNPYIEMTYMHLYSVIKVDFVEKYGLEDTNAFPLENVDKSMELDDEYKTSIRDRIKQKVGILEYDCKKDYSITSMIAMFFMFSFAGWFWEVLMHIYQDGTFINRGFMYGPWLPIYGVGGILMLVTLKKYADYPTKIFLLAMAIATVLEYSTGRILLELTGQRWWDYKGYMFNLDAIISLEGIIFFGIGALFFIYAFAPIVDKNLQRFSNKKKQIILGILLLIFIIDLIYSVCNPNVGMGITIQ
ncbi:MAG: DUF975 family protein [Eubacteriales bacterium]|nr:DUF975 family protein [Eubacteriales bacterium]MDY3332671.1 DUF975 family protein [Gallibacter sp.]